MLDALFLYIEQKSAQDLSEQEKNIVAKAFTLKKLRKRQYFLQQGDVCGCLGFIVKGATRMYSVDSRGNEHVLQFGVENFCKACVEAGVDGCIVPDLPMYEYEELYKDIFLKHGLSNIFLVTPQTSEERIRKIDELSNGFVYLISTSATTGQNLQVSDVTTTYFSRVANMGLKNPTMIGFGIRDKQTFDAACQYANGGIIGTAFVSAIATGDLKANITEFMQRFK